MRNSASILNCLLTSIDCRSWHLRSKKRSKWVRTRFRNAVLEVCIIDSWSWSRLSLRQSLMIVSIFSLQSRRRSTTMKARLTDSDQSRITTSSILWKFFTTRKSFIWSMNVWKYRLEVFHLHRRKSWSISRSQRCVKRFDFVLVHHLQVANFHQILDELFYIHTELQLYYDELNCDNVWLKRDDAVKLINVGDVMLNDVKISEDIERKNVCTMSLVMKKLMKSKISLQNPDSIVLKYSENWPNDWEIRTFLKTTQSSILNELKKVQILCQESLD